TSEYVPAVENRCTVVAALNIVEPLSYLPNESDLNEPRLASLDDGANESVRPNESDRDETQCYLGRLATVFADQNVTHTQISAIMQVIKTHGCFSGIHVGPRTISKTPNYSAPTIQVAGGEYLHFGVEQTLLKILSSAPPHLRKECIQIDFSTYSASLDKVGKIVLWPIQIRVANFAQCYLGRLATVFADQNVTHTQISAIMQVIKTHGCFSGIHVGPRTISKTPNYSAPTIQVAGGEYLHFGVEQTLLKILSSAPPHLRKECIQIDFSTYSASLDKVGKIVLWPIQIRVANFDRRNIQREEKANERVRFFQPFNRDVRQVLQSGVDFMGENFPVALRCFVADALARSFSLGHRSHSSKAPCTRCWVRGQYIRPGVIVYTGVDHRPRTQEEYLQKLNADHHSAGIDCSLIDLSVHINLVKSTVFDYMHLVCLDIMENIFKGLIDGRFVKTVKISDANLVGILDDRLEQVKNYCPQDFARKPVGINNHGKFKATELRQLLLYTAPVILNGLVNPALYFYFLLLHASMRILINPRFTPESVAFAEKCIKPSSKQTLTCTGFRSVRFLFSFPLRKQYDLLPKIVQEASQHLQQIANRRAENCGTAFSKSIE
ncbi:hypothetical protein TSAR_001195, partial [Trichomalopsis sarcophagae]